MDPSLKAWPRPEGEASSDREITSILEQARGGDHDAERRLFALLGARIHALAKRKVWDDEAARDIAQDALITIFEKYRAAEFQHGFFPWVFSVLHHKVGNYLKKRGRDLRNESADNDVTSELADAAAEGRMAETELVVAIEEAMRRLSAECLQVIRLLLSGADRTAIHHAMGGPSGSARPSAGTLDSRISRCRRKLLEFMEGTA